ncbi:helix-turn-helix domain-containing protein [Tropicimonas aquimaris]|uniref:Helix-turn-helix domain-containing protein n=1 Tax=Tropicimonas aquimaris TaxID=914152 RepID=A0ABW3IMV0_9RHOB
MWRRSTWRHGASGRATRTGESMETGRPFTPESLAERWGVSATSIRNRCQSGDIPHFRLGRLYRIPEKVVMEFETCASTSDGCGEDTASIGMKTESVDGISLRHAPERKRRARGATAT